jgi:hypothetical protein
MPRRQVGKFPFDHTGRQTLSLRKKEKESQKKEKKSKERRQTISLCSQLKKKIKRTEERRGEKTGGWGGNRPLSGGGGTL